RQIEAALRSAWPFLPEGRHRAIDEVGEATGETVISQVKTRHCPGAIVLDHDIRTFDQTTRQSIVVGLLQVEGDRSLVAIERSKIFAEPIAERRPLTQRVAARRLDLDNFCTHICKQHSAEGPRRDITELDYPHARQRRLRAEIILIQGCLPMLD